MFFFVRRKKTPLDEGVPWITYGAKAWLDSNLTADMKVFEWGSGGSTLYYSKMCKSLVSIEHDPEWLKKVTGKIKKRENIKYELVIPTKGKGYTSSDQRYSNMSFERYCKSILKYPNNYFDLVSVDGRARYDCVRFARRKVKKGGYLLFDNSDVESHKKGLDLLKGWIRKDYYGRGPLNDYSWQTTIFKKST